MGTFDEFAKHGPNILGGRDILGDAEARNRKTRAMMTKMKTLPTPYGNRILVRRAEAESKSKGGIVLPDVSKEKPTAGLVLKVPEGVWSEEKGEYESLDILEGSTVIFSRYGGTEIDVDGETLVILNADDVLAVMP
jgi:chaperonin GroES